MSDSSFSHADPLLQRAFPLLDQFRDQAAPTLWLKPPSGCLFPPGTNRIDDRYWHPWYPEHERLSQEGWKPAEPGELERQWAQLALFGGKQKEENRTLVRAALARCPPQGQLLFIVPNDYGSRSYGKLLAGLGEVRAEEIGRRSRLFVLAPKEQASPEEHPLVPVLQNSEGYWSTPGLFSWKAADRGSALLAQILGEQKLRGPVADLGSGWGYLATRLPADLPITLFEADQRGHTAAQKNLPDRSVAYRWCDLTEPNLLPKGETHRYATVITNPPFHTSRQSEPVLGAAFTATAHRLLKRNGQLFLVGNSHLPYRAVLEAIYSKVEPLVSEGGFNVFRARV